MKTNIQILLEYKPDLSGFENFDIKEVLELMKRVRKEVEKGVESDNDEK